MHTKLMTNAANASAESCIYVIRDCRQAMSAMPDGDKAGEYADTLHYHAMRLVELRTGKLNAAFSQFR